MKNWFDMIDQREVREIKRLKICEQEVHDFSEEN